MADRRDRCPGSSTSPASNHVSRVAIRTAVADLQPGRAPRQPGEPVPVVLEMPGKLANHVRSNDKLGEAEHAALTAGREVRRGQGFTLHVAATPQVHQALLAAAVALGAESSGRRRSQGLPGLPAATHRRGDAPRQVWPTGPVVSRHGRRPPARPILSSAPP